jgi:FdhE protein
MSCPLKKRILRDRENLLTTARESVENAVDHWLERLPSSSAVLNAFKEVLVQEAEMRDEIAFDPQVSGPYIDPEAYRQGAPLLGRGALVITEEQALRAAERIIPALRHGFPAVSADLDKIAGLISDRAFDLPEALRSAIWDQRASIDEKAVSCGVDGQVVALVLSRMVKPFAEKMAATVPPPPEKWQWLKGYCPICGSWPSLSVIRAPYGERFLKCAFCSHEWRHLRTACPFCENEDPETLEIAYAEDRDSEHACLCRKCMKYVLGVDLRKRIDDPLLEVVPFALTYLDMLAQDSGFRPGAAGDASAP